MTWTRITDDPTTLPSLDEVVVLLTPDGSATISVRTKPKRRRKSLLKAPAMWQWNWLSDAPYWCSEHSRWSTDDLATVHVDTSPTHWHPLPDPSYADRPEAK